VAISLNGGLNMIFVCAFLEFGHERIRDRLNSSVKGCTGDSCFSVPLVILFPCSECITKPRREFWP